MIYNRRMMAIDKIKFNKNRLMNPILVKLVKKIIRVQIFLTHNKKENKSIMKKCTRTQFRLNQELNFIKKMKVIQKLNE
jgi:hypothetical protein